MLQPRIRPHRITPSLLLRLSSLNLHPLPTQSTFQCQFRKASHASQGRANKAAPGPGKRLGAKKTQHELVVPGNIIFRQRGTHWFPGENCGMGRDHTIFAKAKGYVRYYRDWVQRNGTGHGGLGGGVVGRGMERKFIGIVFEKGEDLPRGRGEATRRRVGMVGVQMEEELETSVLPPQTEAVPSKSKSKSLSTVPSMRLKSGYMYRLSNAEIGRTAERENIKSKVRPFKPGDRFLAWRKRKARVAAGIERRGLLGNRKGAKAKK
ncbi:MAG: 54S ribosomal protein L2 mitochondrial [Icmadophila ericetorum]|nr:54S ribosomal protein L2 mitochondrial [Icmadophila ericetorum]